MLTNVHPRGCDCMYKSSFCTLTPAPEPEPSNAEGDMSPNSILEVNPIYIYIPGQGAHQSFIL